jgi:hypothetical protein
MLEESVELNVTQISFKCPIFIKMSQMYSHRCKQCTKSHLHP